MNAIFILVIANKSDSLTIGYVDILVADTMDFDNQSKDKLVRIQSRVDALAFRAIHFDGLGCLAFDRNGYPRAQEQTCT
jgi:hypothetical protein